MDSLPMPLGPAAPLPLGVVLCSHNPRQDFLERSLRSLRRQTLANDRWELLIVDNASAPPLAPRLDLSWQRQPRLLLEPTLGLTRARLHAIAHARGDLLVFVDDDNLLAEDYLQQALQIAADHPHLGSWSGQCQAEFEAPPPAWTQRYWGNLCIRQFDQPLWSNLPRLAETMPTGAGLCVRRAVAQLYLQLHQRGERRLSFDRVGSSLLSGGDNDLAACACRLGLGVGLFPQLQLRHLIPPERLTPAYLARLAEGIAYSSVLLDAVWQQPVALRSRSGRLLDLLRLLRRSAPERLIQRAAYRGRNRAAAVVVAGQRSR